LRRAGRVEVGGLLLGEHVSEDTFRVVDMTAQRHGGSHTGFMRDPEAHAADLASFFERTKGDYARFNYLGEWHSHPNVPATPSASDVAEMIRLVDDPEVGVTFAVLLVVGSTLFRRLTGTATVFAPSQTPMHAKLIWEQRVRSRCS
jgi:integrative and conjugative element protein (TIGR02256 family)